MKKTVYQLVAPYRFKAVKKNLSLREGEVLVRPTKGSICAADVRYFTGARRPEALKSKLPMALIHEGIGVVENPNGAERFRPKDRVVVVPAVPGYVHLTGRITSREECCPACRTGGVGENHCRNIKFLSSGFDGLCQDLMDHPSDCLQPIPDEVPDNHAVLSELLSVAYNAASRLPEDLGGAQVCVMGDGPMGYIVASVIKQFRDPGPSNLHLVGTDYEKMARFDFATCYNVHTENLSNILPPMDYAFECVGGIFAEDAINFAIDYANPGATLFLLGVSEKNVPVNTRDILEKGITLFGVSRSPKEDYPPVLESLKDPVFQDRLSRLIHPEEFVIRNVQDLKRAFNFTAAKDYWGKVILKFDW